MALPIQTYKLTMNPWRPLEKAYSGDLVKTEDFLFYTRCMRETHTAEVEALRESHTAEVEALQYSFGEDEDYWGKKVNEAIEGAVILLGVSITSTVIAIILAIKIWVA